MRFDVFQQLPPKKNGEVEADGTEWHDAVLVPVGTVEAHSDVAAIALARTWPRFSQRSKSTLMAFPIVEGPEQVPDDIQ